MTDRTDTTGKVALGTPTGFLAFGLGSGLSPIAPGTAGSLLALPLALGWIWQSPAWVAAILAAAFLLGVWLCGTTARRLRVHDHSGIVWDEFVGMWTVLACAPVDWRWWLTAFVLFRIFDILKPWPVRWLDRRVAGGFGIMIDDVVAAGYAVVVMRVLVWIVGG